MNWKQINWKTTAAGSLLAILELAKAAKPSWVPVLTTIQTVVVSTGLVAAADAPKQPPTKG
jgi:hypothetical protein